MQSNSTNVHPASPLIRALRDCILPALEWNVWSHTVIAQKKRKLLTLPPGVNAVPLKLQGRRVAVRSSKAFQRAVLLSAKWPKDGMHELRISKLAVVIRGTAALRMGDYVLQCPAGTVIFLPLGIPQTDNTFSHLETLSPHIQQCSLLWLTPMMSGLACRVCHTSGKMHKTDAAGEKVFLHRPQVLQLFQMLGEVAGEAAREQSSESGADKVNMPVFESILLSLMRMARRDILENDYLFQDVPPHQEEYSLGVNSIDQAVHYINTHYANSMDLDEIARRFLMSRAQFTKKFRAHTGQSFLQFLNARRLEQACQLLRETDWTAVMITYYVGFGSVEYFHRLFMREMSVSPIQYRKNVAANQINIRVVNDVAE